MQTTRHFLLEFGFNKKSNLLSVLCYVKCVFVNPFKTFSKYVTKLMSKTFQIFFHI